MTAGDADTWPAGLLGNAPVSYGVFGTTVGGASPADLLASIAQAGYAGTELGPPGFFGSVDETVQALHRNGLQAIAAYAPVHFTADDDTVRHDLDLVAHTCRELAAAGARLLVLADEGSQTLLENPARAWDDRSLALTDAQWRRFWALVGREALGRDPRFATMAARAENIAEIYRLAGECMLARTTGDWLAALARIEIPAAHVRSLLDLLEDEHLAAVGFFQRARHPSEGDIVMPSPPARFGATPSAIERLQPRLGEHSREVLAEAGLTAAEIERVLGPNRSFPA